MRKLMLAAAFLMALPAVSMAQGKIGYVDSQKIFAESAEFQEAQTKLDKEVEEWQNQAAAMDAEIKKMKEEFDKNSLVWSATKKKESETILQAKQDTMQQFLDTTFGQNGKAERRMAELSKPIRDRIVGIIRRVAIENDFEIVLDAANVSIAFAKENLDLTDEVLAEIAKEK